MGTAKSGAGDGERVRERDREAWEGSLLLIVVAELQLLVRE